MNWSFTFDTELNHLKCLLISLVQEPLSCCSNRQTGSAINRLFVSRRVADFDRKSCYPPIHQNPSPECPPGELSVSPNSPDPRTPITSRSHFVTVTHCRLPAHNVTDRASLFPHKNLFASSSADSYSQYLLMTLFPNPPRPQHCH